MLALTLTITTLISIMFFFVGGVVGWLTKQHFYEKAYLSSLPVTHPEMFDSDGNLIPDEIIAIRFENTDDYDYNYDEEEND
jgi:hypothetical protein